MSPSHRWLPWLIPAAVAAATGWAMSVATLPPADLTFCNGTEIKSIDPAAVTGMPEGRVVEALFEGLCRRHPVDLRPQPGMAERWEISPDGRTYTFYLRADARWSDGSPLTADDFRYSFRRFLAPETLGEYGYQLWYVKNAKRFSTQGAAPGERVEVELPRAAGAVNTSAPPTLVGTLRRVETAGDRKTFHVEIDGRIRKFSSQPADADVERCAWVLLHFDEVGVRVVNPRRLELTLEHPTPYFLDILSFYPLSPVNRRCLETHGAPQWTRAENLVSNGPFRMQWRRIRDRIRLVKNEQYWNRDAVKLGVVDVLAVEGSTTMLNMYLTGQADWITDVPPMVAPELMASRPQEFAPTPMLGTYFYRFNVTKPPFDKAEVRRALTLAIDRRSIVDTAARMGQVPAYSLVPPGIAGYDPAECGAENLDEARRLLAAAGFPGGRGFPKFELVYNTQDAHKAIAEMIQDRWKRTLGIDVGLRNLEWGVFLDTVRMLDYRTARASWIGDYADPNTFLDMFMSKNENNQTGWSDAEYDRLVEAAAAEADPVRRMRTLRAAETILMRELPIMPIYFYVSRDLVRPYVRGFHKNVRDEHPLWALEIDDAERREVLAREARR